MLPAIVFPIVVLPLMLVIVFDVFVFVFVVFEMLLIVLLGATLLPCVGILVVVTSDDVVEGAEVRLVANTIFDNNTTVTNDIKINTIDFLKIFPSLFIITILHIYHTQKIKKSLVFFKKNLKTF